ncbi:GT4 family glycosyltransferase PelF [Paenibacillus cremeus]|nr:GT4 family glycosyltransferase PelF [Paenibacillus cremeus]
MHSKIKVLLSTEGTYPFHQGGVSTWCDILVQELKSVDYMIYSVLMNPFVTQKFQLPSHASLIKMPLWGTEEPCEHLSVPFSDIYLAKRRTREKEVKQYFIPLFKQLVEELLAEIKSPQKFGSILLQLYQYFQTYEYKASFKTEATWETYKQIVLTVCNQAHSGIARPDVYSLIQSIGWIYRFMNIINTPVPKVHVTHAAAAAFCGIPCVLSKLLNNTPYMLTEHGVYLREQYLSLSKRAYTPFLSTFLMRFIHSITSLNYTFADQVSPVCQYNTRWETRFGVRPKNIQVIYNGVDPNIFIEAPAASQPAPTVVMVARVDPIKDIITFMRAAEVVLKQIPEAKFIVYGSVSVPSYYEECLELKNQMNLGDSFIFAGHTQNMAAAYQSGDVIALSSISEAFPYSVVEGMMTGKPVIATDVGGIAEALGDTGILVPPRDHEQLGQGIIKLLNDPELRFELGKDGRERALNFFTLERVLDLHLKSYIKMALRVQESAPAELRPAPAAMQKLYMDKAYSLQAHGLYEEAIRQFRLAIQATPYSVHVPLIFTEIAAIYNKLGQYDMVLQEMDKCQAYIEMMELKKPDTA